MDFGKLRPVLAMLADLASRSAGMQQRVTEALTARTVSAVAGGGLVSAKFDLSGRCVSIVIDPSLLTQKNAKEMIESLTRTAVNNAMALVNEQAPAVKLEVMQGDLKDMNISELVSKMAGGFGGGGFGGFGGGSGGGFGGGGQNRLR